MYVHMSITLQLGLAVGTCTKALLIHKHELTTLHNYQRHTKVLGSHIPRPKLSDLIGLFIATKCNRKEKQKILVVKLMLNTFSGCHQAKF